MIEESGKRYLTVREFATRAGVSNQAIYKQVVNQLSTYVIVVDNQKFIDETALSEVYKIEVDNQVDNFDNQVDNQIDNEKTSLNGTDQEQGQNDISRELIEMLKEEIKKKDQQIEKLQASIEKAYMQISEMAQKAQYITAADKTEKIMQQQPKEEIIEPAAAENENTEKKGNTEEQPKKKWFQFWKR